MRGSIEGIDSTCSQIILSLLEQCFLARVSFKRGTMVNPYVCVGEKFEKGTTLLISQIRGLLSEGKTITITYIL